MKKAIIPAAIAVGTLFPLVLAGAAHAASGDYVTDAVNTLESGQTYVAPDTDGAPLASAYNGTTVGVVVLPGDAFDTLTPANFATQIYSQVSDKYETVIVVNADPNSQSVYGVAPNELSETVWSVIGGNNNSQDGRIEGLVKDRTELVSVVGTASAPVESGDGGFNAAPLVGVGGGLLAAVALTAVVTNVVRGRRRNRVQAITTRAVKSNSMRNAMERFADLTRIHLDKNFETSAPMRSVLAHLNELFGRLERKGVGNAKQLAEVNYTDTIQKLNEALGQDYYLDIIKKPELWDRPSERLREVEDAVKAVDGQLLENIRQVNSSKDLDFRVALESILRSVDQPNASDMIG